MANLYELTAEYLKLQEILENTDATDEDFETIAELFKLSESDIEEKAENYAKVIRNLEGKVTAFKAEEARISKARKQFESSINRLKNTLYESMIATDKRKFEKGLFKFAIQKNGGALPVKVLVPVEELPDELVIIDEKPNLKAIAEYINETGDVTFAEFGERGEHLTIK